MPFFFLSFIHLLLFFFTSDGRVPHDGLWPLAGWRASLTGLRCPSPAREDGHAVLLAQAFVGAPVGLNLFAQAAFTLDDFQQLAISLGLRGGRGGASADGRLSLRQLGELLELQLQVVLLLELLELLLQLELLLVELKLLLLPGNAGTAGTAGHLRLGQTVQLNTMETKKISQNHLFFFALSGHLSLFAACT